MLRHDALSKSNQAIILTLVQYVVLRAVSNHFFHLCFFILDFASLHGCQILARGVIIFDEAITIDSYSWYHHFC